MKLRNILGQPSWTISNNAAEASVTRMGGQLAPVTFRLRDRRISPFHVAPWCEEKQLDDLPNILKALRGDFFCMPFGSNATPYRNEAHPVHGETANNSWELLESEHRGDKTDLKLVLYTKARKTRVEKLIRLMQGHHAIYSRHTVSGGSGRMSFGHHAMLKFDEVARISTSRISFGQVYPGQFEDPAKGGYSSLKPGAEFRSLDKVPLVTGGDADLTSYPAREGFEDLVMVSSRPGDDFAWTAASFPKQGYVWFGLKDPRVLASTVMWHSNGGRHYRPWNGRHRAVLGLEEVTSYFHDGLAASAGKNSVNTKGIPTAITLSPKKPLIVNVIMGIAAIPNTFGAVKRIEKIADGIRIRGKDDKVNVPLDHAFLYES